MIKKFKQLQVVIKKASLMLLIAIGFSVSTFAQTRTITGKVVDGNGEPQVGVTVFIDGTKIGTNTETNGAYTLKGVPAKSTLVFSSIGYQTQRISIKDKSIINVTMVEEATQLEGATVTAEFGIKRVSKAVGSSVQNVKAEEIVESGRDNFITALQGRVSGISITSSTGAPGASTQVVLRNFTSLSGSNQPLYVIDGVPMNNSTFDPTGFADPGESLSTRQLDFASQGNDFNPEDIESMTVLKGASAAALYGSDASNGAIIITTKKGSKGRGKVTYSTSLRLDNAYGYPEIQTKYANGAYGTTNGYYTSRFGAEYAPGTKLYDNFKTLTQTGKTMRHSIAIDGGTDKISLRASASYIDQTGVVKKTDYSRLNLGLSGKADIKPWLTIEASMSFASTTNNKAPKGDGGVLHRTFLWPSTDDMSNYLAADGQHMREQLTGYIDEDLINPLFALNKNKYYDESDRVISSFRTTLKPIKNMFAIVTAGWDIGANTYETSTHPYYGDYSSDSYNGRYNLSKGNYNYFNLTAVVGYTYNFTKDFQVQAQFGYEQKDQKYKRLSTYGQDYLDPNFISINNCDQDNLSVRTSNTDRRIQGLFGAFEFSYKDMVYLTIRGRNDWSSTLPANNRSFFYPNVDASWIVTELPALKKSSWLSYLKLKASFARVGKDAPPLSIYPALETTGLYGGGYKYGYTGPNPKLKPEMTTSYEGGFEARLWKQRVNMDVSFYRTRCKDQLVTGFRLSYATGFVLNNMNVGTFDTWGWEAHIDGDIISSKDWTWNVGVNGSHGGSKVVYLPQNVSEYYNAYTWVIENIRNGISVGHPITTLTCLAKQRNKDGKLIINKGTGLPLVETGTWSIIGDREPKIRFGFTTRLRWKQFQLSALFDGRLSATVVNGTKWMMWKRGLSDESVKYRESGNIIFDGVLNDGYENTDTPTKNTIAVNLALSGASIYAGTNEDWIEKNVNYLRLQELRFTYRVPRAWLQKETKGVLSDASVFVAGNDLVTFTNYSGIDVVGNSNSAALGGTGGYGFDMYSIPNPRGITFGLTLTF